MLLLKSKILAVMVVFMVLIGQATASSYDSCQITTHDQKSHLMMDTAPSPSQEMSNYLKPKGAENASETTDCCPQNCTCPLGDCASVMILSAPVSGGEIIALQKSGQRVFLITKQFPTTLFRPPIVL